ncbi:class I SAM-dependent methyltransferase [Gillisia sp. M10.2A]|uniref:Class I SAM-dependent methyltransferase n=1 Tax=Gillisia lutea TaxID=2909668 RepID=A0ABS9EGW8_9FLAO|nr:class I SAM-dependent methyltransferase [Gillisia lutea]MCF4102124.1 class I SAM-dependent methyltransferase [Gillisia lutea]
MALIHKTDKFGYHFYTPHYQEHFKKFKYKKIKMLEIGVGGYKNPYLGGNSLRMWKSYFPLAKIFSFDIYDKSFLQERRINIFKGSQIDEAFLDELMQNVGEPTIIIDDGSHINNHVIKTFEILFPKLKLGGIYVVEDIQTSYWEEKGGSSLELNSSQTIMGYFKGLIDGLNHKEFNNPGYDPNYFDLNIISMHFYHNLIVIYKGLNNEPSNFMVNNEKPQ